MTEFSWSMLATGIGCFMAVGSITVVLKAVFGLYWKSLYNNIATLVLSLAIPPLAIWAFAESNGEQVVIGSLVLAFFNGFLVAGSLLGTNALYRAKTQADLVRQMAVVDEELLYGERG